MKKENIVTYVAIWVVMGQLLTHMILKRPKTTSMRGSESLHVQNVEENHRCTNIDLTDLDAEPILVRRTFMLPQHAGTVERRLHA